MSNIRRYLNGISQFNDITYQRRANDLKKFVENGGLAKLLKIALPVSFAVLARGLYTENDLVAGVGGGLLVAEGVYSLLL